MTEAEAEYVVSALRGAIAEVGGVPNEGSVPEVPVSEIRI
jgi:hypothetical protein